jgi:Predicted Zn-dependent protease (DUF2268)
MDLEHRLKTAPVRALSVIACVVALACDDAPSGPGSDAYPDSPAEAQFVTSDIEHFWDAYDAGRSASAFQERYLNAASPGLRDFIQARALTASSLTQMVLAFPRYFGAIRANMLRLTEPNAVLDQIRQNYADIESLYPAAVFPPVSFLVGRFSTGGTVRRSGILIGTEFFVIDDTTPLDELGSFQRANVKSLDSIPFIVAHEHAHVLQGQAGGQGPNATLLAQSLMEGSADFIGELTSGGHMNAHVHAYGFLHERELWTEFKAVMHGTTNVSQWLYNQGSSTGERPGDLGYFIGYRIAQAFYNRAADKTAALRAIIEVRDAFAFLAASGYDGGP